MERRDRTVLSWLDIGALALAGGAAGVAGAVALALIAGWVMSGRAEGLQDLAAVVLGMFAGFVILAPVGVSLAGRALHAHGSVLLTCVAAVVAGMIGLAVPNMLPVNAFSQALVVSVPVLTLVAAVAVYALSHNRQAR